MGGVMLRNGSTTLAGDEHWTKPSIELLNFEQRNLPGAHGVRNSGIYDIGAMGKRVYLKWGNW
jgi:hypothetical protein